MTKQKTYDRVERSGESPGRRQDGRPIVGHRPIPLDGGYGWAIVFGAFAIHVFSDGFVYSFGVLAEPLIKQFESSNADMSTVLSLLTGLMLAVGPLASAICNRIGCRATSIFGAILASIGCAASCYATSINYLRLSVGVVMGCGFGFMYCPAIVIVTLYFERRRSLATGVTVCGAGVGTFVFSKVIDWLINSFGWRRVFLIYAGIILLCVPCGALFRPIEMAPIFADDPHNEDDEEEEVGAGRSKCSGTSASASSSSIGSEAPDGGVVVVEPAAARNALAEERRPLRRRLGGGVSRMWSSFAPFANGAFAVYAVSNFLASIGFNAPPMFLPLNAQELRFADDGSNSLALYGLASVLGRIAFGLACDWRPPLRWTRDASRNRLVVLAVSLMVCGVATGCVFAIKTVGPYLVYSFFFGFFISSFVCLSSVALVDLVGMDRMSNAFGLLLFIQGVATFVGPPLAGWFFDLTGHYYLTFAFCGVCLFVSGLILFTIPWLQPAKGCAAGDGRRFSAQWRRRDRLAPAAVKSADEKNVFTVAATPPAGAVLCPLPIAEAGSCPI